MRYALVLVIGCVLLLGCATAGTVSRSSYGADWPLTVDSGEMECYEGAEVVFIGPNGAGYAMNGTARGSGKAYLDGLDILLPGKTPADLGRLIDIGLSLCA